MNAISPEAPLEPNRYKRSIYNSYWCRYAYFHQLWKSHVCHYLHLGQLQPQDIRFTSFYDQLNWTAFLHVSI